MPKKILLADDSVTIQKVVELTFMEGDYEVTCVSNGRAAVQKIQEARPDILLCDVIMPEMNGYDVAAFVKKNPVFGAIPVILLTGTFEPFDEEKARLSGADTYITKPFDSRLLVEKVEELISRRMVMDAAPAGPVQITQSLQEFTLESPPQTPAMVPEVVAAVEEEKPFLTPELEFSVPSEDAFPPETAPTPAPQVPVKEPPSTARELLGAPVDGSEETFVSRDVMEALDVGPISPEDAIPDAVFEGVVSPPLHPATEPGELVLPTFDTEPEPVAPARESVAFAAEPGTLGEVESVSLGGAEEWGVSKPFEEVGAAPAAETMRHEGLGGLVFDAGTGDEPQVIHAMTEQQEMVSEAQILLDQGGEEPPAELPAPVEAFQEEAIISSVEALATPPEPVTDAFQIPPVPHADKPVPPPPVVAEESPFLPEEGVETGLPEIQALPEHLPTPEAVEADATAESPILLSVPVPAIAAEEPSVPPEIAEPVTAELEPEPEPLPLPEETPTEAFVPAPVGILETAPEVPEAPAAFADLVPEAVELEQPAVEEALAPESAPEPVPEPVPEPAPEPAFMAPEEALPAPPLAAPEEPEAPAVEPEEPAKVAFGRDELEKIVRMVVEDLAPHLIRQVVEETAPGVVQQVVNSIAPDTVRQVVSSIAPDAVRQVVSEIAPDAARQAMSQVAPDAIRQVVNQVAPEAVRLVAQDVVQSEVRRSVEQSVPEEVKRLTGELLPGAVTQAVGGSLPEAVTKAAGEAAPAAAQEVVGRMAPDIVRQVVEGIAPAAVAENVRRMTAEIVAEEVKKAAADSVRQVAWEVIPELAESLIKRRIQELEAEVG